MWSYTKHSPNRLNTRTTTERLHQIGEILLSDIASQVDYGLEPLRNIEATAYEIDSVLHAFRVGLGGIIYR